MAHRHRTSKFEDLSPELRLEVMGHCDGRQLAKIAKVSKGFKYMISGSRYSSFLDNTMNLAKYGLVPIKGSPLGATMLRSFAELYAYKWNNLFYNPLSRMFFLKSYEDARFVSGPGFTQKLEEPRQFMYGPRTYAYNTPVVRYGLEKFAGTLGNHVFGIFCSRDSNGDSLSTLEILRLPALRMITKSQCSRGEYWEDYRIERRIELKVGFRIRALAINEAEAKYILLEHRRKDWIFHIYCFRTNQFLKAIIVPRHLGPVDYENESLEIEQFELCGETLGMFAGGKIVMANIASEIFYHVILGTHDEYGISISGPGQEPLRTGFFGFHFLSPLNLLICCRALYGADKWRNKGVEGLRYYTLGQTNGDHFIFAFPDGVETGLMCKFRFLPNISPVSDTKLVKNTPFTHDPADRLVGYTLTDSRQGDRVTAFILKESVFTSPAVLDQAYTYNYIPTEFGFIDGTDWNLPYAADPNDIMRDQFRARDPETHDMRIIGNRLYFSAWKIDKPYRSSPYRRDNVIRHRLSCFIFNSLETIETQEMAYPGPDPKNYPQRPWYISKTGYTSRKPKESTDLILSGRMDVHNQYCDRIIATEDNIVFFTNSTAVDDPSTPHDIQRFPAHFTVYPL